MRVFISKNLEVNHPVHQWASSLGHTLLDKALISHQVQDPLPPLPLSDWIFFSSPSSARLFVEHFPKELQARKIAAIGKGTARFLHPFTNVAFEGSMPNTAEVAKAFAAYSYGEKTLFPQSQISRRSVQGFCDPDNVIDYLFYKTLPAGEVIDADICFFTSPSNAKAFAQHNTPKDEVIYLAIGDSTAGALKDLGYPLHGSPSSWKARAWVELLSSFDQNQ